MNGDKSPMHAILKYVEGKFVPGYVKEFGPIRDDALIPLAGPEFEMLMMNHEHLDGMGSAYSIQNSQAEVKIKTDIRSMLEGQDYSSSDGGSGNEQAEQTSRQQERRAIDWNQSLGGTSVHTTKRNQEQTSRFEYFLYSNMDNVRSFRFIWIVTLGIIAYYCWNLISLVFYSATITSYSTLLESASKILKNFCQIESDIYSFIWIAEINRLWRDQI